MITPTDPLYREIIIEHWKHPQNYGSLKAADIDASEANPLCGDEIRITIQITNNEIKEILFTSQGCAISKASASLFTELIRKKNIQTALNISTQNLLDELGIELSPARLKCALLIYSLVGRQLREYLKKK